MDNQPQPQSIQPPQPLQPQQPTQSMQQPMQTNAQPEMSPAFPQNAVPEKPKNHLKIIIPLVALVVAAIVALIIVLMQKPAAPSNPETPKGQEIPKTQYEDVSLSWFDYDIPGHNYKVEIKAATGEYSLRNQPGCSTVECLDGTDSIDAVEYSGVFSEADLKKVLEFYELIKPTSEEETRARAYYLNFWFLALANLATPDKVSINCNESGEVGQADCGTMDLDGDGVVTYRETAYGVLDELVEEFRAGN